ncbi:isopentenyldiphosphate isomerase [Gracilibacillus halotolerans]|uniref:Isopentenyldiphosphate isomerase n=1 Tax=Gracilibacillus halotolerans TaxID=74386 RepID=A0A841RNP5_9BACI|nr:NUDIX domain-containing protein [Gracilibacillus halotolerans]MBB6513497.1 isopentenyldiphosphate isomerase [Gracilibacillus halotolerans]
MTDELLKIFDENRKELGVAPRSDVHRFGYWHDTFHCWFTTRIEDVVYIYLQLRSENKEDYPNLLDITAAGHLTNDETVEDGIREIEEEVGIPVSYTDLEKLTTIKYSVEKNEFIDNEFAHVYLYHCTQNLDDFSVQEDEVAGIVLANFEEFSQLWFGERESLNIKGFKMNKYGNRESYDEIVGKEKFVPHPISFYEEVIRRIKRKI